MRNPGAALLTTSALVAALAVGGVAEAAPAPATFPQDISSPEHGGKYVAVVLASGRQAKLRAANRSVAEFGYDAAISDVGCISGAAEALDLPDNALVTSLLFAGPRKARRFTRAYAAQGRTVVGRAPITAYCLD